jgi:hypothetical protein
MFALLSAACLLLQTVISIQTELVTVPVSDRPSFRVITVTYVVEP